MEHPNTFMILLFFDRSRPKVLKAVHFFHELSFREDITNKQKMGLIIQKIESLDMFEFVFIKPPSRNTFEQVDYNRSLFNMVDFDKHEMETRTKSGDSAYLHGSIFFKKKYDQLSLFTINKAT